MKRVAFLTSHELASLTADDQLLAAELRASKEYEVIPVIWNARQDWKSYDLVIIRSPWDYWENSEKFFETLKEISSQTRLMNPYSTVMWNIHKGYLKELENQGTAIVPTLLFKHTEQVVIPQNWQGEKFILKPAVSANAYKTFILSRKEIENHTYTSQLHPGDWILQPFLDEIRNGEISLHYFNRKFSHAVIKIPKEGDFRVQEAYGGEFRPLKANPSLLAIGDKIVSQIPGELLYGRVDLVASGGTYLLMELELIEPTLNFRYDLLASQSFLKAMKALRL